MIGTTWFLLSLGAAVTQATQFAVIKGRARNLAPLAIVMWTQSVAFVAWVIYFAIARHAVDVPRFTWLAIATSAVLVLGMSGLLARASARGDISVVGPVFALSPVFTVIPDAVLSATLPSPLGWVGLAFAVAGTVSLSGGAAGATLRAVFTRPDARDALGAAVFLGFLAAVDRWGARALGAPSYLLCSHGATAVLTLGVLLVRSPAALAASLNTRDLATVVMHGVLGVTGTGMQTTALTMAPATYVNAIRRMSAVVAVVFGRAFFGEADLGRRLVAALLACAGAVCLLFAR